jgi:hypothetical protein
VGNDVDVLAAIDQAMDRIDRFCGDKFSPRTMTVVARVGGDGRALLPYRLTDRASITEVRDAGWPDYVLTATYYRAYSSAIDGEVDAVGIGQPHVGYNILINGLEPWAENRPVYERLEVTGTFGWAVTPSGVEWATATLAASISRTMLPDPDDDPETPPPATAVIADPEGNVLPVVPPFQDGQAEEPDAVSERTTGNRQVDSVLLPYRRNTVLMAGI